MVLTSKPPSAYLTIFINEKIINVIAIITHKSLAKTKQLPKHARTSEQGGQSPSQQRRLQACRPQSRILWHFLSHAKS